jgi:hypothetical protein
MECINKSDASDNTGNLNHLKIIRKIPEQHTCKARNQGPQKTDTLGTAHILRKVLR